MEGFQKLNESISLYNPPDRPITQNANNNKHTDGPSLIVYCSWMGAAPKHIAKYTSGYRENFPQASILLVQCSVSAIFVTKDLEPAYQTILAHLPEKINKKTQQESAARVGGQGDGKTGIVLCMASNGGATNSIRLLQLFKQRLGFCPFDAVLFDCCPSSPAISGAASAFATTIPVKSASMRVAIYYTFYLLFFLWMLFDRFVVRKDGLITRLRKNMRDASLIPVGTPRLYVYSRADKMVHWEAVHAHADEARREGYRDVSEEIFTSAPHCALLNEDKERYWRCVRGLLR